MIYYYKKSTKTLLLKLESLARLQVTLSTQNSTAIQYTNNKQVENQI